MDTSTESQEGHAEQNTEDEEEQPAKSKKGFSRSIASVYFDTLLVLWSIYQCMLGLGDMAKKIITIIFFISVDIDNYHDKCQIFISFKFKPRILLQSESCRNQTINFP